ncbi:MAG: alpha/beta hydrolase [Nocardioides sp.]|nr:alpha/beta hydrolase [Nocardioides sp.]
MRLSRRTLLASVGVTALVSGCGGDDVTGVEKITYGDDASQFGELTRPSGTSRGVVVVIHGGFWKAAYDLDLGRPLAADLVERGWTTWNIEYRRVGSGGGFPATFDDVHTAIEKLADVDVDTGRVVTLGHSAGGHLATWAAARGRFDEWQATVPVTEVISQAGVLDLTSAFVQNLGDGAVGALMDGPPGPDYDLGDPTRQIPLDVPVWCVHGRSDTVVPPDQSVKYVERARAAGATAEDVSVDGDHFVVINPNSPAWARTVEILDQIG